MPTPGIGSVGVATAGDSANRYYKDHREPPHRSYIYPGTPTTLTHGPEPGRFCVAATARGSPTQCCDRMFVYMASREPQSVLDHLWKVHRLAQHAVSARLAVAEAMQAARQAGASDDQLAEVTGLSVDAVADRIAQYRRWQDASHRPDWSGTVGRPPPRTRNRGDMPR